MTPRRTVLDRIRTAAAALRAGAYTVVRGHIDWQAWPSHAAPAAIAVAVANGHILEDVMRSEDAAGQSMRVMIDIGRMAPTAMGHDVDDSTLDEIYDDAAAILRDLLGSGLIRGYRTGSDELTEWHQPAGTPGTSALQGVLLQVTIDH